MNWRQNIVQYRRDLHEIPELGFAEHQTRDYLWRKLEEMGLRPRAVGETGITVDIAGTRPGKNVALRADMDALPLTEETGLPFASRHDGIMHACGHDAHMAILLALGERLTEEPDFGGRVRLLFQPAEELPPGGALELIRADALDGIDEVYGLHVWAGLPLGTVGLRPGPMMANSDRFTVHVRGKGGHGSQPQVTKDAVLIAAQIVVNLQTIVARRVPPFEPAVVTCGTIQGGRNYNIIAETADIAGTVRTFSAGIQSLIAQEIDRIAQRTAAVYDAEAEVVFEKCFPAVINHERETAAWGEKIRDVVDVQIPEPDMGGEDFAYYLQHTPGAFLFLGAAQDEGETPPHHSPHFLVNERALLLGVEVLYRTFAR